MNLDDLERSGSPAFLPGGHAMYAGRSTSPAFHSRGPAVHSGHQSFNPGPHGHYSHGGGASQQHVPGGMPTAANGPLLSVEEFMTRQGTLDTVVADPSNATLDMRTALPGHQFTGSPFAGQAYVPPHGNQSGFMPGYQGYSGALMSGRSLFNNQAQSAAAGKSRLNFVLIPVVSHLNLRS